MNPGEFEEANGRAECPRLGVGTSCGGSHAHAKAVSRTPADRLPARCTYGWGCDVKVAGPATLLTDCPTPGDSPAQPPALGAILRDEWGPGNVDP
jgi:hypothetical protein